ncbi:MAG: ComEC/Rec2 family competence protein [Candidatus Andersenbacteria bacterium]
MKQVIALLLFCWIGGMCVGQVAKPHLLVALIAVALVFILVIYRWHVPVILAGVALLLLGSIYGGEAPLKLRSLCPTNGDVEGVITAVENREESAAQYRVKVEDCVVLLTTARFPEYHTGNQVRIVGTLQPVEDIPEPYTSYAQYLSRQGIAATARYVEVERISNNVSLLESIKVRMQRQIGTVLYEPEAGVVQAMLLGERGGISDALTEQFRRSGISHIIAISGLHISLIAAMLLLVSLRLPLSRPLRFLGILVVLWIYVVLVGAPPSAVRAGMFWSVTLIALTSHSLVSLPTVLLVSLAGIVTVHPVIVQEAGFQLSVAAVMGIGVALMLVRSWYDKIAHANTLYASVISVLIVSVGAQLTTWPLVSYYFEQVPIFGLIANVLTVPLVPIFLAVGIVTLLISFIFLPIGYVGSGILHGMWLWVDLVSGTVAHLPFSVISLRLSWQMVVIYYLLLISSIICIMRWRGRSLREVWQ